LSFYDNGFAYFYDGDGNFLGKSDILSSGPTPDGITVPEQAGAASFRLYMTDTPASIQEAIIGNFSLYEVSK